MDGKKLDQILHFTLKNEGSNIHPSSIKKELFPDLHEDEIKVMISIIAQYNPKVITTYSGNISQTIMSNGITKPFLDNGGFTKIQIEKAQEQKLIIEKENLEFEKSKLDLELAKKNLKEFPKIKLRANIGLGIAIILAIVQLIQWIIELTSN
jgi:hypothetical protein